jgi:hypothetical protein
VKVILALLFVLSASATASVAFAWGNTESYRQTCRDIRQDQFEIQANCLNMRGQLVATSIDYRNCVGDISNQNGILTCRHDGHGGGGHGGGGWLPRGSYLQTCRGCDTQRDMLYCECKDTRGNWLQTELEFDRCRSEIANIDGRLMCN